MQVRCVFVNVGVPEEGGKTIQPDHVASIRPELGYQRSELESYTRMKFVSMLRERS